MVEGCWYIGVASMEERIIATLNEMSEYLSISQMKKIAGSNLKKFL